MARQNVSMVEHSCDSAHSCGRTDHAAEDAPAPAGWYYGNAARVVAGEPAEPVEWEACQARHIRGAIEHVTGTNGGDGGDGEADSGEEGSAAEVADDPTEAAATETEVSAVMGTQAGARA